MIGLEIYIFFVKNRKFITLVSLLLKQVYEYQLKLKIKSEVEESVNTNQIMSFKERRKSDSIEREKNSELAKDGQKNIEKKANKIKQIFEGKTKKHMSFM